MSIEIKLDQFEGPFDLLYHLIDKNKIDIADIPISEITEQYMDHISQMKELDMENVSEFMLMAATLIKIKSKMLLPKTKEELAEEDPREELVERLLEYKKYKEASEKIITREEFSKILYKQKSDIEKYTTVKQVTLEDVLVDISFDEITQAFIKLMKVHTDKIDTVRSEFKSIKRDLFTIEHKMEYILSNLNREEKIDFFDLFNDDADKQEKVVTFLALLELIKIKKITIKQNKMFDRIEIGKMENQG